MLALVCSGVQASDAVDTCVWCRHHARVAASIATALLQTGLHVSMEVSWLLCMANLRATCALSLALHAPYAAYSLL
jgi:hypothetical protein